MKTPEHRDRMVEEQESPIMWKKPVISAGNGYMQPFVVPEHMQGCKNHG